MSTIDWKARDEAAEAERDALRAKLAEAEGKYRFFVWTDHASYLAVAHARSVEEARQALEDNDLGGLDGSCPEREKARRVIYSETPAIYYGKNAEFCVIGIDGQEQLENNRDTLASHNAALRAALEVGINSAHPHPTEHPTMTAAWKVMRDALALTPPAALDDLRRKLIGEESDRWITAIRKIDLGLCDFIDEGDIEARLAEWLDDLRRREREAALREAADVIEAKASGEQMTGAFAAKYLRDRADATAAAAALDRLAALERELAEARNDGARLTHVIEESNKGKGWLTSDVWDKAAALCPLDAKEADNVQKWVRAVIDADMGVE